MSHEIQKYVSPFYLKAKQVVGHQTSDKCYFIKSVFTFVEKRKQYPTQPHLHRTINGPIPKYLSGQQLDGLTNLLRRVKEAKQECIEALNENNLH